MRKPKILLLDIETSMMLMGAFSPKTDYIQHTHMIQDWNIICAAWKWLGEKEICAAAVPKTRLTDDRRVVVKLAKLIERADIIIGHNIDQFDIKKIKWRMLKHGLEPFDKPTTVDTLKVAKREAFASYNKLDFLAKELGVGGKTSNTRGLWVRLLQGDASALSEMVKYNKNDIKIQEGVYKKLLPYITNHPNMNVILDRDILSCKNCGSKHIIRKGYRFTNTGKYRRWKCQSCGANFRGKKLIKSYDGR